MYVYYCKNCESFEMFENIDGNHNCSSCNDLLISLGYEIGEWNRLSDNEMMEVINRKKQQVGNEIIRKPAQLNKFYCYHIESCVLRDDKPNIEDWMDDSLKKKLLDMYNSYKGLWQINCSSENIDSVHVGDMLTFYDDTKKPLGECRVVAVEESQLNQKKDSLTKQGRLINGLTNTVLRFDPKEGNPPQNAAYISKSGEPLPEFILTKGNSIDKLREEAKKEEELGKDLASIAKNEFLKCNYIEAFCFAKAAQKKGCFEGTSDIITQSAKKIDSNTNSSEKDIFLEETNKIEKGDDVQTIINRIKHRFDECGVKCPRCGSNQIQVVRKNFSFLRGFATNAVERVCVNCKHRF